MVSRRRTVPISHCPPPCDVTVYRWGAEAGRIAAAPPSTGGVLEAALRLADARTAVPAVDADVRRAVAQVEAAAAVGVRVAAVAETHVVRQPAPRVPPTRTHTGAAQWLAAFVA